MNCSQAYNYMMKYFDGELNNEEHAKLIHHINKCSQCCAEFQEYSSIVKVLEEDTEIEPPENFEMTVMSKIRSIEINTAPRRENRLLALSFLSGVFLLTMMFLCSVFLKDYLLEIMKYWGIPAGIAYTVYGMLSNCADKIKVLIRLMYCFNSIYNDIYYIFAGLLVIAAVSKIYKTEYVERKSKKPASAFKNE